MNLLHTQVLNTEVFADMTTRLFRVQRLGYKESKNVYHLQYHWWTSGGVPIHPIPFLQFLRKVLCLLVLKNPNNGQNHR